MVFKKIIISDDSKATIIIRLMVAIVFLSEGIQKFIFPYLLGVGRFEKIGLPYPSFFGSFVGTFEIVCGFFILLGLLTRLACIPLITIMIGAILTTKLKIYYSAGFWELLHESRTDWSMFLGSLFLLIKGSGYWSLDYSLSKRSIRKFKGLKV